MEERQRYWLAGLIEGEGSFLRPSPSRPSSPAISLSMTDEDIVSRVAVIFQVKYHSSSSKNPNHKTVYSVILRGHRAVDVMHELYPLMSQRRQRQIDYALGNHIYKADKKGQNNGQSKLTDDDVRDIRRRLANGESQSSVATVFGVSKRAISDIHCGKTWPHIISPSG